MLSGIFNRLGTGAETWHARLEKLNAGRPLGRFFAASPLVTWTVDGY
jgi:hypothetical protein